MTTGRVGKSRGVSFRNDEVPHMTKLPDEQPGQEPQEAMGTIYTHVDCPCGCVIDVEGDAQGDVITCDCGRAIKLEVRMR